MAKGIGLLILTGIAAATLFIAAPVTAQEDVTPPTLVEVTFEPESIDTGKGPVTVTVTIHVQDDLSGFRDGLVVFVLPGTTQERVAQIQPFHKPTEGSNLDGHYVVDMVLPQYSGYGVWEMDFYALVDNVGNYINGTKPDDEQGLTGPTWPALYNGFGFLVAPDDSDLPYSIFVPAMRN